MKNVYTAAEARNDFSAILNSVAFGKTSVIIERYGDPVAKIVPVDMSVTKRDLPNLVAKYYGMWAKKSWAKTVGKPSRYFRKR